jgi:hypothetical protein
MTSYTNSRPGAGLLVVDHDLGTASGLLASRCRTSPICIAVSLDNLRVSARRRPVSRSISNFAIMFAASIRLRELSVRGDAWFVVS